MNTNAIIAELRQIQSTNSENLLKPADVVSFARDPRTELHKHFEWDDSEAASKFRIAQARDLIQRVWVTVTESPAVEHRAFVSLLPDRTLPGGGYRDIEGVMADPVKTRSYLETALMEFRALQKKYQSVEALSPVFSALNKVEAKAKRLGKTVKTAPAHV